ncbi:MAG: hypothetical protein H7Z38_08000 [Rubrivivax sp.]|nr:hypothetical protein [Pyrinomonadaceae bacterium]
MKKAHLSPVTSLLMSLSLIVGILVCDLTGTKFSTTAQAQANPCSAGGNSGTVVSNVVEITEGGTSVNGMVINNVQVAGQVIPQAVIAGSVQISASTVVSDGGITVNGVIVSDGIPCANGVIVSDGVTANGVIVSDGVTANGVIVSDGITATGGTLEGDNISVEGGIVSGNNLRLVGASLTGTSVRIGGIITGIRVSPTN